MRIIGLLVAGVLLFGDTVAAQTLADGLQAFARGDYTTAATVLTPLAETRDHPDPTAAFFLGLLLRSGQGIRFSWERACGMFLRAQEPGSVLAAQAEALNREDVANPLMRAECEAASRGPRVLPPTTTFVLGPAHRVRISGEQLIVEQGGESRVSRVSLGGYSVRYLPVRYTRVTAGGPDGSHRDFIEFLMWIPARTAAEPRWALTWWVYEVTGLDVLFVDMNHLVTSSNAAEPPMDDGLARMVGLRVAGDGQVEWQIEGAERARGLVRPRSTP